MEVLEFCKTQRRMCDSYPLCHGCPLEGNHCDLSAANSETVNRKIIAVVEKWGKENPVKTKQDEFLKMFPHATVDEDDGILAICPLAVDNTFVCDEEERCEECRKKFWGKEI